MFNRMRQRASEERGFTLIELLVVILIIGILAAIAIPSFLNQKSKASDASAKELARTAQTAAETSATDNGGSYTGVSTTSLNSIEPTIPIVSNTTNAFLTTASGNANSYTVVAQAEPTGDQFTITRGSAGTVSRTCSPVGSGGCAVTNW